MKERELTEAEKAEFRRLWREADRLNTDESWAAYDAALDKLDSGE